MNTARFPSSLKHLISLLQGSRYLERLSKNPAEQMLKNKTQYAHNLDGLIRFYASNSKEATRKDRQHIQDAVAKLYRLYPKLPSLPIYFVFLDSKGPLEFGYTSFTINSVVFLQPNVGADTIMHECIHVIQRFHLEWFDNVCAKFGLAPIDLWRLDGFPGQVIISNPDADEWYIDKNNDIVAYNSKLQPCIMKISNPTRVKVLNGTKIKLLGGTVRKDSVSEMVAVRLTDPSFTSDSQMVEEVNHFLEKLGSFWRPG